MIRIECGEGFTRELFHNEVASLNGISYRVVEIGKWITDLKWQDSYAVAVDEKGDHWTFNVKRSGSYYTYYEYQYDDTLLKVVSKPFQFMQWVPAEN